MYIYIDMYVYKYIYIFIIFHPYHDVIPIKSIPFEIHPPSAWAPRRSFVRGRSHSGSHDAHAQGGASDPNKMVYQVGEPWALYGCYMVVIRLLYGCDMVVIWLLYGCYMVVVWLLYGYYMDIINA